MEKCMYRCFAAVSLSLIFSAIPRAQADVTLPKVIGSHMVLQRGRPLPIWGWADPGEKVTVTLDAATAVAKADKKGNWKVELPAVKADGKPHSMTIQGKNKIDLDDILIGEVWIGSGQSNMEFQVRTTHKAAEAVAAANHPQIRLLHIRKTQSAKPAKDVVIEGRPVATSDSAWRICSPETVPNFSAVLYFFGQRLNKDLAVPVGLINSSWGGSPIEAWIVGGDKNGGMYNAMIVPIAPLAMRGAIWYQGEANVNIGLKYADKMQALIGGWRKVWECDFPFYFVQIAPFSGYRDQLPPLWEAQVASLKIPGTGMAVTTDLVENIRDIHPKNKIDVGNRLALWALAKTYGKNLVYSGPLYRSMSVEGSKVRLAFAHVGGGLKSRDGKPLIEFEIAGADGKFVPAEAAIDGDAVVVQSAEVASPTQVRFGWRNVANPNLINKEGLPASPFQTKDWQGGTGE
jgi:sialate O-acetylesterase